MKVARYSARASSRRVPSPAAAGTQSLAKPWRLLLALLAFPMLAQAQLAVTPLGSGGVTPTTMTNTLLSGASGITIVSVTYNGANIASGLFSGGGNIVGFDNGILLTTGAVTNVVGPNDFDGTTTSNGLPGDPQLDQLVGGATEDASVLEITFIPSGNQAQFSYVFASEEYNEYVDTEFNDVFAFFVNGTNFALVPGSQTPVAINNINCGETGTGAGPNCSLFIDNPVGSGNVNIEYNGLTEVLSFIAPVTPGTQNVLRLTIADRGDDLLDSGVFLAGGSFSAGLPRPTLAFTASPVFVAPGGSVALAWNTTNASSCTPSGGGGTTWSQQGQLPTSGTRAIAVPGNATGRLDFVLSCQGQGGSTSQTATVNIGAAPANPPPPVVRLMNPSIDGQRPSGPSTRPSLSANGGAVVYESSARNLVAGDTNGSQDVFLRDNVTNTTTRVSVSSSGQQLSNVSGEPSVDRAGNRVVLTIGTGLAAGSSAKTVTGGQVHSFNKAEQRTQLISNANGSTAPANGPSGVPQVSEDGVLVVFSSDATNLTVEPDTNGVADAYLHNLETGVKARLSDAAAAGTPAAKAAVGVQSCSRPAGNRVVCEVVRGNPARRDIVAYSTLLKAATGTTVSFGAGNAIANGESRNPVLTANGRFAFFDSAASNLVPGDTNNRRDVFRAEFSSTGTVVGIQRVSLATNGAEANGDSERPGTCGTGQYVTFESVATNLLPGDDAQRDTYARDLNTGLLAKMSQPQGGGNANGASGFAAFSPDCSAIAFATSAENIAAGGAANQDDVVAGPSPFLVGNVTGGWFDPLQSGQGLLVEHLPDGRVIASFYTFTPGGQQVWFVGVGTLVGNVAVLDTLLVENGRFPPAFNPNALTRLPFGTMTLRFDSCDSGELAFAFPAPYGSGILPLRRPVLAAGVTCSATAMAPDSALSRGKLGRLPTDAIHGPESKATGPVAALTGSWANPAELGHGFQMEVLGGDQLLVAWYVFTPTGEQLWLIGVGPIVGQTAVIPALRTLGGRFIPNFDPNQITRPSLGNMTVTATGCNSARVDYAFQAPFGSGTQPIVRISQPRGVSCTP